MRLATTSLLAAIAAAQPGSALACACCAEFGERFVSRVAVSRVERDILDQVRFASRADTTWGSHYDQPVAVSMSKEEGQWTFTLRLEDGRDAHLVFRVPEDVSRFEVDPRDPAVAQHPAGGALLYKEWKLISEAVGDGYLSDSVGGDQMAALILQGRGNRCPNVSDFNAWTIVLYGSRADVTVFGDLEK